ncbi:hypothetical protein [Streptomyces sp. NRRL S-646]|nr:hypothetical protein [Streptomyces sp. NRRL S-646]
MYVVHDHALSAPAQDAQAVALELRDRAEIHGPAVLHQLHLAAPDA